MTPPRRGSASVDVIVVGLTRSSTAFAGAPTTNPREHHCIDNHTRSNLATENLWQPTHMTPIPATPSPGMTSHTKPTAVYKRPRSHQGKLPATRSPSGNLGTESR